MVEETALVPFDNYAIHQFEPGELAELMKANTGGEVGQFDLDRVKIPSGGGTTWTVPDIDGEIDTKELIGVMVYWRSGRTYYVESFDTTGGGTPPDCYSDDGEFGVGLYGVGGEMEVRKSGPAGACQTCPMAEWGSEDPTDEEKKGQACRQLRVVYLLTHDSVIPKVLVLPPTSLAAHKKFMLGLFGKKTPYWGAVVKITLKKDKSASGISYASAVFERLETLPPEKAKTMREYGQEIANVFDKFIDVIVEDVSMTVEDITAEDVVEAGE